jgi:hypothetical protein
MSLGFDECKVFISNVDSQSSAEGGILVQVLGEMSNKGGPWRKFAQTFFLAEQPNGYFVLNDVFRYIKEDNDDEAPAEAAPVPQTTAQPHQEAVVEPEAVPAPQFDRVAEAPALAPQVNGVHQEAKPTVSSPAFPSPAPGQQTTVSLGKSESVPPVANAAPAAHPAAEAPPPSERSVPETVAPPAPAAAVEAPAPSAANGPSSVAAPTAEAPAAAAAPQAPAAAAATPEPAPSAAASSAPKSWASLAAAGSRQWGPAASSAAGVVASVAPSSSSAGAERSGATSPAQPGQQQQQQQGQGQQQQQRGPRPSSRFDPASISTPHVFIKHVVETITDDALRKTLTARFGPINNLHIARSKACAFLEFSSVDAARKAIQVSQRQEFGGEGGIQVNGEWIHLEKKKDGAERPPPTNRGRGAGGDRGGRGGGGSARGQYSRGSENRESVGGQGGQGGQGGPERTPAALPSSNKQQAVSAK